MTPLRQRMLDAMTVRGLAERTKECYIEAVARLARHYDQSPDLLDPAEVEAYLLHLVKDRKLSYSSVNHAASASRVDWAQAVAGAGGRRGRSAQGAAVRCAGQQKQTERASSHWAQCAGAALHLAWALGPAQEGDRLGRCRCNARPRHRPVCRRQLGVNTVALWVIIS